MPAADRWGDGVVACAAGRPGAGSAQLKFLVVGVGTVDGRMSTNMGGFWMSSVRIGYIGIVLLVVGTLAGCSVLQSATGKGCGNNGWCGEADEADAQGPVGARQKEHHGLLWPPYPRPVGERMEFWQIFHHAHYWPYPYNCQDRDYVRSFSALQVAKGWTAQTTLYDYHFDPDTHQLNQSGRLMLAWILGNAPPEHRKVYVQTASSEYASQQRLAHVQEEVNKLTDELQAPTVALRLTEPLGRPAVEADMIRRNELDTMLPPRITYEAPPTGTGEGG